MKIFKKIGRWFDLNLGWLFINGNKTEQYRKFLKEKYENNKRNNST